MKAPKPGEIKFDKAIKLLTAHEALVELSPREIKRNLLSISAYLSPIQINQIKTIENLYELFDFIEHGKML